MSLIPLSGSGLCDAVTIKPTARPPRLRERSAASAPMRKKVESSLRRHTARSSVSTCRSLASAQVQTRRCVQLGLGAEAGSAVREVRPRMPWTDGTHEAARDAMEGADPQQREAATCTRLVAGVWWARALCAPPTKTRFKK